MKKQRMLFSLICVILTILLVFFFLTKSSNHKTFGDIEVQFEAQKFEMKIPSSLEPFIDENGEQIVWQVLEDSPSDIAFDAPDNIYKDDQTLLGLVKGQVLHSGKVSFKLERSSPSERKKESYQVELTSDGQKIRDIQIKEIKN